MPLFRSPATCAALAALVLTFAASPLYAASTGTSPPPPSFGRAASTDTLQTMTGGTDTHITNNVNEQDTNGTLNDNSATGTFSGANVVGDTAFSNSAGLPTVIQNSGNNVLIQNSTIINVRMNP